MIYFWLYIWDADWLINLADTHWVTMKDVHKWYYFCCLYVPVMVNWLVMILEIQFHVISAEQK